jgi:hypothetical protein
LRQRIDTRASQVDPFGRRVEDGCLARRHSRCCSRRDDPANRRSRCAKAPRRCPGVPGPNWAACGPFVHLGGLPCGFRSARRPDSETEAAPDPPLHLPPEQATVTQLTDSRTSEERPPTAWVAGERRRP